MSGPTEPPVPPPAGDEVGRLWLAYDQLLARTMALEEISDRLAATCADPQAVADYWMWKAEG